MLSQWFPFVPRWILADLQAACCVIAHTRYQVECVLSPGFHHQILCFPPPPLCPGNVKCSVENFLDLGVMLNLVVS